MNGSELTRIYDVCIVSGGIVGLATAWQLTNLLPHLKILVLEKESAVASHQTGRNSGVLHSGIYYKPGSQRAINCRTGKLELQAFCEKGLQRLVPEIEAKHLVPAPSGVRAQAVLTSGLIVDDFLITESDNAILGNNASLPAATAALSIGRIVSERIAKRLGGETLLPPV